MRGVILDSDSFDRDDLDTAALDACLDHWVRHRSTRPGEVLERIDGSEVVVTNKVVIDAAAMATPALQLIVVAATGTNNIDLTAAARQGITVCNVRDYASAAVSQHVFSLILALVTRLGDYTQAVRHGYWQQSEVFSGTLASGSPASPKVFRCRSWSVPDRAARRYPMAESRWILCWKNLT